MLMKAHHWQACLSTGARLHTSKTHAAGWKHQTEDFLPELRRRFQFIKGKNKPFIYTQRINKDFLLTLAELFKKLIK